MIEQRDAEFLPISLSIGKHVKIVHLLLTIEGECDDLHFCLR